MKFFEKRFIDKISKARTVVKRIEREMSERIESGKQGIRSSIAKHPVSIEISGREDSENISGTLNLPSYKGAEANLWGFLGFNSGQDPIVELDMQVDEINYFKNGRIYSRAKTGNSIIGQRYRISIPNFGSPLPWTNTNWIDAVEYGIDGLEHFLYKPKRQGRSGGGVQIDNYLRSSQMKGVDFMTGIISEFIKGVKE